LAQYDRSDNHRDRRCRAGRGDAPEIAAMNLFAGMTWFEIYALFGSPVVLVLIALVVMWITGLQDKRDERKSAKS
jgi:hypothetical protein